MTDAFVFGRDVLGPLVRLFCYRLHAHLAMYGDRKAAALFVARGGLRLGHWYGLFLERHGRRPPIPLGRLHVSRLVAMKAGLVHAPDAMAAHIAAEYQGMSTGEALRCFLPPDQYAAWMAAVGGRPARVPFSAAVLTGAMAGKGPGADVIAAYARHQNDALARHFAAATGGRPPDTALLVDTGWSGSIVAALQAALPAQPMRALFLGRYAYGGPPPPVFADIAGLLAEGTAFDPARPLTALFRHRHLIEGLCEIPWPSATGFDDRDEPETGLPPEDVIAPGPGEAMALGVTAHVQEQAAALDAGQLAAGAARAARRLARAVRFPRPGDAPDRTVATRSADFGKTVLVPVLLPPAATADAKRRNIERSLWPEGQIALEYPWTRLYRQWRCRGPVERSSVVVPASAATRRPPASESDMSLPLCEHEPILPRLTPAVRELCPVPGTAQTTLNIDSMVNFLPLLEPVMRAAAPARVCEIGMGSGALSRALAAWCGAAGADLDLVDPVDPARTLAQDVPPHVALHAETSEAYFAHGRPAGLWFVDGDHNHHTVTAELTAIERLCAEGPLVVVLHDVGWPNGRRDTFYSLDTVPETVTRGRLAPELVLPLLDDGASPAYGLSYVGAMAGIAAQDGGPGNGVLTAVEDFLRARPDWDFFTIPSLYGLGIAWPRTRATPSLAAELASLRAFADRFRPLAATLELNRLRLLATLTVSGTVWREQHGYIAELEDGVARRDALVAETRVMLARTLAEQALDAGFDEVVLCGAGGMQGLAPLLIPALRAAGVPLAGYIDHLPIGDAATLCDVPVLDRARWKGRASRAFVILSPGYGSDIRETLAKAGIPAAALFLPAHQRPPKKR